MNCALGFFNPTVGSGVYYVCPAGLASHYPGASACVGTSLMQFTFEVITYCVNLTALPQTSPPGTFSISELTAKLAAKLAAFSSAEQVANQTAQLSTQSFTHSAEQSTIYASHK